MKYPASVGVLTFVGILIFSGASSGGKLTNYEVFRSQVDTLSTSIVDVLTGRQIKSLNCLHRPGEIEMFVRQRIEERLLDDKFRLLTDSVSGPKLRFGVPLAQVEYSAPVSSHIFASPDVKRTIQSEYDIEISDSGEVIFAKSYSFVFADTVRESDIADLESGSFGFLHGKIDPGGFLDTMLQPVFFLASAAVIVYLFFTLRGS
jgi:hypothetical protein